MIKRWFIDTEFMEERGRMELLSIAIVSEDGSEKLYAINRDANISRANDWVIKNVIPRIHHEWFKHAIHLDEIKKKIMELIPPKPKDPGAEWHKPEFWGYYCDYDWVNFCWIFGKMIDLPNGYPMYCLDLKQVSKLHDDFQFEKQDPNAEHHAMNDAEWNRQQYLKLVELNYL